MSEPQRTPTETGWRFFLHSAAKRLLPHDRLAACSTAIVPGKNAVQIRHNAQSGSAWCGNVMMCSRLWTCPVCAQRISAKRRTALRAGLARSSWLPIMVTLTLQHHAHESITNVWARYNKAFAKMTSGRRWMALKESLSLAGSISATEVTYGENGWHVHGHTLLFVDIMREVRAVPEGARTGVIEQAAYDVDVHVWREWKGAVEYSGGYVSKAAFDVTTSNNHLIEYVSKFGELPRPHGRGWGAADELTRSIAKEVRSKDGKTPFALLADYANGDKGAGALFVDYALATKGRQQLRFSAGLKASLGILDIDEVPEDEHPQYQVLAELNHRQWAVVLGNDARAELLAAASKGIATEVWDFLDTLPGMTDHEIYNHPVIQHYEKPLGTD